MPSGQLLIKEMPIRITFTWPSIQQKDNWFSFNRVQDGHCQMLSMLLRCYKISVKCILRIGCTFYIKSMDFTWNFSTFCTSLKNKIIEKTSFIKHLPLMYISRKATSVYLTWQRWRVNQYLYTFRRVRIKESKALLISPPLPSWPATYVWIFQSSGRTCWLIIIPSKWIQLVRKSNDVAICCRRWLGVGGTKHLIIIIRIR